MLEEYVGVLSHAAGYRGIGVEGAVAEISKGFLVDKGSELILVDGLDFLDFVGCAETVEEVDERHAALERCEMGNGCEVHHLLNGAFAQHREACLASRHDVLMVAEDTQRVGSESTCRNMEYAGEKLAGDFIHVRDHQEKTLRSGVGSGQRAGLQRAVDCACGATFTLHLLHEYCLSENVLPACSRPVVYVFRHGR